MKFAATDIKKLSFYQWINMEYGIVKKQYKQLSIKDKNMLRKKYEED